MNTLNSLTDRARLASLLADDATPRWLRETHRYLAVKSQFVLYGNIRDTVAFRVGDQLYDLRTITEALHDTLALVGYEHFFVVDPIRGVSILTPTDAPDERAHFTRTKSWAAELIGDLPLTFHIAADGKRCAAEAAFPAAVEFAERIAYARSAKAAIFFNYLMGTTDGGQSRDSHSFIRSLIASYEAKPTEWFNPLFWLTDRENDLPAWFSLGNPRIRSLSVAKPDKLVRGTVAASLLQSVPGYDDLSADQRSEAIAEFTAQTDGMALNDLALIAHFATDQGLTAGKIGDAARSYKLGSIDDPWARMGKVDLDRAESRIRDRVRGQAAAITKTLDIVRRAIKGLSGAQGGKSNSRPKGVLFFAGPTGVGKTELAKSLTEGLFGDERAYIRFDMSEFNHEHADQRLIGAPPGYIGFEAGGELTEAIRERPCSIVLFDEIEKAHGKILDKFLQILDDGQLTSAKGERVYFSDALIIFTSNLGITREVTAALAYDELEETIRRGVTKYFKDELRRPELLNRIGDNVVVFDFVRPDVAAQILDTMLANVVTRMHDAQGVRVVVSDSVRATLYERATADLSNGGRGIGNLLEAMLINPLGRTLWDLEAKPGQTVHLLALEVTGGVPRLTARLA